MNKQMMSNNTSGVTGIYRTGTPNSSRKNPKINYYWLAYWRSVDGKSQYKRFNIEIYGEECARQLAINHRKEQIQLLETNHNIKYSERYGI